MKKQIYNISYSVSLMLMGILGAVFFANSALSNTLYGIIIGAGLMSIVDHFIFKRIQSNLSQKDSDDRN